MNESKRTVIFDIETNGINNPDRLWCVVCRVLGEETKHRFTYPFDIQQFLDFCSTVDIWVGHNIIEYDCKWLEYLLDIKLFDENNTIDTLVLSRLLWVGRPGGHSLESWGERLGVPKDLFDDFSQYSEALLARCDQDVDLNYSVYERLMAKMKDEDRWREVIDVEHRIAWMARRMHEHGFTFNIDQAQLMLDEVTARTQELYNLMVDEFPPKVVETQLKTKVRIDTIPFNPASPKQVVERLNEFGWSPVEKTKGHLQAERDKSPKLAHFREYGWKVNENNISTLPDITPIERFVTECRISVPISGGNISKTTISEIKKRGEKQREITTTQTRNVIKITDLNDLMASLSKTMTGWLMNSPDSAEFVRALSINCSSITVTPQELCVDFSATDVMATLVGTSCMQKLRSRISTSMACNLLVEWLLVDARRRTLTEWLNVYNAETGCIHGKFSPLGTVTQRWIHTKPNMGNVPTAKTIKYNSPHLREIAIDYGARMRSLWTCPKDTWLVGVDMESAHLRIFGHLINDKDFIEALVSGDKALGTDPHTMNKKKLGDLCVDRDRAKTFKIMDVYKTIEFRGHLCQS